MTRTNTVAAFFTMAALSMILISCSDSGVEPTGFGTESWKYEKGDRLVFHTINLVDGEEVSNEFDTSEVADRVVTEKAVDLVFEDGSIWRVVDGTFEYIIYGIFRQVVGKVPAPSGRWPGYQDTLDVTNDQGEVIGKAYEIFTTVNGDTTITTNAGSFRCSVADVHYEDKDGNVVENQGRIRFYYAPGHGLVKYNTHDMELVDGTLVPTEYSSELYQVL